MAAALAIAMAGSAASAQVDRPEIVPLYPGAEPPGLNFDQIRYASSEGQISLVVPRRDRPRPLAILLAGADFARDARQYSTAWLPNLLYESGFAVAIVQTSPPRRIRAAGVLDETIAALRTLAEQADRRSYDMNRIVLVGRGAGGNLAALLATDPDRVVPAGVAPDALRAAVIVNGDAFDLPARIEGAPAFARALYERAFGADVATRMQSSPAAHIGPPDAPLFLLFATDRLGDYVAQAEAFAARLREASATVHLERVPPSLDAASTLLGAPQNPYSRPLRERLLEAVGESAEGG